MSSKLLVPLFLAAVSLQLRAQSLQAYEAVEPHMGTLFRIKLYAGSKEQAQAAFTAAFKRIGELDAELTDYKADTELSRLTREAVDHPAPVSDDLLRILSASQKLSADTGGAFDITVGALTHLWRDARKQKQLPEHDALAQALVRTGFRKLHLDLSEHTAEVDQPGMQLDAGAIAKGDAADQALAVIARYGIKSALVAASGDLAFSGPPPGEAGWKIGLDSFDKPGSPFTRVLVLSNAAVSTSGANEQHFCVAGTCYSHIIDPNSGMALTRDITVSVVAPRGIDADSFATAISVLGPERGVAFVNRQPGASAIILTVENGKSSIIECGSHSGTAQRYPRPVQLPRL
jgi:FAD:protein FMN transferase